MASIVILFRQVFFFFLWLSFGLVIWSRLGDLFVSENPWEVLIVQGGCTNTICLYRQISVIIIILSYYFIFIYLFVYLF